MRKRNRCRKQAAVVLMALSLAVSENGVVTAAAETENAGSQAAVTETADQQAADQQAADQPHQGKVLTTSHTVDKGQQHTADHAVDRIHRHITVLKCFDGSIAAADTNHRIQRSKRQ